MIVCVTLDVEGVLLPELWSVLADQTGEDAFRRTTTEEADNAVVMSHRLAAAQRIGLTRFEIETALHDVMPLAGALEFLREIRSRWPTVLVSDSFSEMLNVIGHRLLRPTAFCHRLLFDADGKLIGRHFRQRDQKPEVVAALRSISFKVMAAGDSLNDIGMLKVADAGAFLHAPPHIHVAHSDVPAFGDYASLLTFFEANAANLETAE